MKEKVSSHRSDPWTDSCSDRVIALEITGAERKREGYIALHKSHKGCEIRHLYGIMTGEHAAKHFAQSIPSHPIVTLAPILPATQSALPILRTCVFLRS